MSTKNPIKPTKAHAVKILELVSCGLSSGLGNQNPGEMCVEAAVCYAFGLPHSDRPPCVGSAVRSFKIRLNDCEWGSNQTRAEGMKKLAIAQLVSNELNQTEFARRLAIKTVQKLLPPLFTMVAMKQEEPHKSRMLEAAAKCQSVKDAASAAAAASATSAAYAAYAAASAAYAYASAYACACACASASADSAADSADSAASATSAAYAASAADAAADSAADAAADKTLFLRLMADIGLEVLIEMKSPGCKWLNLIK